MRTAGDRRRRWLLLHAGAFLLASVLATGVWWIAERSQGMRTTFWPGLLMLLLLVPLALLYAYGPRADRADGAEPPGRSLLPRHPLRRDLGWLALVVAGPAAYLGYLALATGSPLSPFTSASAWHRELAGPLGGAWDGAVAAWAGVRQLLSGAREPVLFPAAAGDPFFVAAHNVGDFAFLLFALVAAAGVLRRLPAAYGAWTLCCLALFLSFPAAPEPLASLPRYLAVVFPLHMWLAWWATGRRWRAPVVLGLSAAGLAGLSAAFSTWQWVA